MFCSKNHLKGLRMKYQSFDQKILSVPPASEATVRGHWTWPTIAVHWSFPAGAGHFCRWNETHKNKQYCYWIFIGSIYLSESTEWMKTLDELFGFLCVSYAFGPSKKTAEFWPAWCHRPQAAPERLNCQPAWLWRQHLPMTMAKVKV